MNAETLPPAHPKPRQPRALSPPKSKLSPSSWRCRAPSPEGPAGASPRAGGLEALLSHSEAVRPRTWEQSLGRSGRELSCAGGQPALRRGRITRDELQNVFRKLDVTSRTPLATLEIESASTPHRKKSRRSRRCDPMGSLLAVGAHINAADCVLVVEGSAGSRRGIAAVRFYILDESSLLHDAFAPSSDARIWL